MKKIALMVLFLLPISAHAQAAPTASLTWDFLAADVTTYGVTGFDVQRKAEACTASALQFTALTTALPAARGYVDASVAAGKVYCFRVRANAPVTALNPQGNSGFSNTAEKTIPLPTIPVPTNLLVNLITALIDALQEFKVGLVNQ